MKAPKNFSPSASIATVRHRTSGFSTDGGHRRSLRADPSSADIRSPRHAKPAPEGRPEKQKSQGVTNVTAWLRKGVVETRRIELPTFALRTRRSPS